MPPAAALQLPARTPRGERTAERILDEAEALFAERGYDGTHLRDVADAVGIRTPSLYNHFGGKEDLYAAVLERGIRPVLESLQTFVTARGDARRQRVLLERVVRQLSRRPNLARLVQLEVLTGGARLTPRLRAWIGPLFAHGAEIIATGPAADRWNADQVPLLVLALYHVVVGPFAIAPFYEEMTGVDLLSESALAQQTKFLDALVSRLLPDDAEDRGP